MQVENRINSEAVVLLKVVDLLDTRSRNKEARHLTNRTAGYRKYLPSSERSSHLEVARGMSRRYGQYQRRA